MNTPYEITDKVIENAKNVKNGEVIFENVTYIYKNNNTKVLDDFSLTIPAGQKLLLLVLPEQGRLLCAFINEII